MTAFPLPDIFTKLVSGYSTNQQTPQLLWEDVKRHYNAKGRHYHTLAHLQNMYEQLLSVKEAIEDWDTVLFALFYHDIIYRTTAKDNEEKSAAFAEKVLKQIGYPDLKMERCRNHIIATKSHLISIDNDTNYFTDADLGILGAGWPEYEAYTKAIRKEYSLYYPERTELAFLKCDCKMPTPIFIRKSLVNQLGSVVLAIICLVAVSYSWAVTLFSFVNLLITVALVVFIFSTLKKVMRRKIQIALSDEGMVLQEEQLIKWEEVKDVFLEDRWTYIKVRRRQRKLTYLNIEPVFSREFSGKQALKSIMVSDMDMRPAIILHHINAFRRWYHLSTSLAE